MSPGLLLAKEFFSKASELPYAEHWKVGEIVRRAVEREQLIAAGQNRVGIEEFRELAFERGDSPASLVDLEVVVAIRRDKTLDTERH